MSSKKQFVKGKKNINTSIDLILGNETVNQIITVLLSTSMFVGGLIGFVLDNTIPGK